MTEQTDIQRTRLYFTGDCDGFSELKESLAEHPGLEVIGSSEHVAQASGVLAGGHLECILHATRSERFPAAEVAAIREQTRAPIVIVASGAASEILEDALDADVSDVLLLPQLVDKPFFGHGLQSVLWAPAMRMGEMFEVTHPHSAYLGALIDFGIIGALLLIAFWFTVWKGLRRLSKDPELAPHQRGFFEGAAASLIAFMAAGFVGSSLTPVPEQAFLWLAIGMMFGVQAKRLLDKDRARRMGRAT